MPATIAPSAFQKTYTTPSKAKKIADRTYQFVATSSVIDRYGDIVDAPSVDWSQYALNPQFLWSHDGDSPPIGRVLAYQLIEYKWVIDVLFNESHLGNEICEAVDSGDINAVSIGFSLPLGQSPEKIKTGQLYKNAIILEISAVTIPANGDALGWQGKSFIVQQPRAALELADRLEAKGMQAVYIRGWATREFNEDDHPRDGHGRFGSGGGGSENKKSGPIGKMADDAHKAVWSAAKAIESLGHGREDGRKIANESEQALTKVKEAEQDGGREKWAAAALAARGVGIRCAGEAHSLHGQLSSKYNQGEFTQGMVDKFDHAMSAWASVLKSAYEDHLKSKGFVLPSWEIDFNRARGSGIDPEMWHREFGGGALPSANTPGSLPAQGQPFSEATTNDPHLGTHPTPEQTVPDLPAQGSGPADTESAKPTCMLSMFVPQHVAKKLAAFKGAEYPEEMHCTLAFLGDAHELGIDGVRKVAQVASEVAAQHPPVEGQVSGHGTFYGPDDGDQPHDVFYAVPDLPSLPAMRDSLVSKLQAAGVPHMKTHGYMPHITLAKIPKGAPHPVDRLEQHALKFDHITLSVGDDHIHYPLNTGMVAGDHDKAQDVAQSDKFAEALAQMTQDNVPKNPPIPLTAFGAHVPPYRRFSEDQPRDEHGRWGAGAHEAHEASKAAHEKVKEAHEKSVAAGLKPGTPADKRIAKAIQASAKAVAASEKASADAKSESAGARQSAIAARNASKDAAEKAGAVFGWSDGGRDATPAIRAAVAAWEGARSAHSNVASMHDDNAHLIKHSGKSYGSLIDRMAVARYGRDAADGDGWAAIGAAGLSVDED